MRKARWPRPQSENSNFRYLKFSHSLRSQSCSRRSLGRDYNGISARISLHSSVGVEAPSNAETLSYMKTQLIAIFVAAFSFGNIARAHQGLSCLVGYLPPLGAESTALKGPTSEHAAEWDGSKNHSDNSKPDHAGRWHTGPNEAPHYYVADPHSSHGHGSINNPDDGLSTHSPSLDCSPIPEPSTYALLLGLTAFGLVVRRRVGAAI